MGILLEVERCIHYFDDSQHIETTNDEETSSKRSEVCDAEYSEHARGKSWFDEYDDPEYI